MSIEIKYIKLKFGIHVFRTKINSAGTRRTMLTALRTVKIGVRTAVKWL